MTRPARNRPPVKNQDEITEIARKQMLTRHNQETRRMEEAATGPVPVMPVTVPIPQNVFEQWKQYKIQEINLNNATGEITLLITQDREVVFDLRKQLVAAEAALEARYDQNDRISRQRQNVGGMLAQIENFAKDAAKVDKNRQWQIDPQMGVFVEVEDPDAPVIPTPTAVPPTEAKAPAPPVAEKAAPASG